MMTMPKAINQLPTDAAWLKLVGDVVERAAAELGCGVLMIAVQARGKMCVVDSHPDGSDKEAYQELMADGLPAFLLTAARVTALAAALEKGEQTEGASQ